MKKVIKKLVPQSAKNIGKHLPEAILANVKYGFPSKDLLVIGVTGTDGKTTTINMIYQVLRDAGKKVAMISTINAVIGDKSYDTGFHVTSPHPATIQRYIKQAKEENVEVLVLEITSHALDQYRAWGIRFNIGVITNITHEHLDYHKTFENYLNTKAKLIKNADYAVLNFDDKSYQQLVPKTSGKIISFGLSRQADINIYKYPLKLQLPGDFNQLNALAALSVASILDIDLKKAIKTLEKITAIEGRMQPIENNRGIRIFVDFAHTPNALEQALKTLRKQTKGRLISVFGAAAERDIAKRPLMGEISSRLVDITILTDEDPRFEDPNKIIDEIAVGAYKNGATDEVNLYKIPDRLEAIKKAIDLSEKGDTIGIFGKGHERSINYWGVEKPWSDQAAVLKALKRLKK